MICACLLLLVGGCSNGGPKGASGDGDAANAAAGAAHVGVVDMDRAAKELGLKLQAGQIMKEHEDALVSQVNEIKSRLQAQVDAKKKEIGDNPAPKDKEELQLLVIQANQAMAGLENQVGSRLQQINSSLVQQLRQIFRDQIKKIADARKMQVVLTSSNDVAIAESVIYSSKTVDVTNDLIEALKGESSKIKLTAPPVPPSQPAISSGPPATGGTPPARTTPPATTPPVTRPPATPPPAPAPPTPAPAVPAPPGPSVPSGTTTGAR
jgi:Skp family chaperone for outer membrane proteins